MIVGETYWVKCLVFKKPSEFSKVWGMKSRYGRGSCKQNSRAPHNSPLPFALSTLRAIVVPIICIQHHYN